MKKKHLLAIGLFCLLLNSGCTSDYGDMSTYGDIIGDPYGGSTRDLSEDIINIVPDNILDIIENLDMPINEGKNPPNLEGIFLEEPHTLKSSNQEGDEVGHEYASWKFRLFNQNNAKLSIQLEYKSGSTTGESTQSFISGSGNKFSIFLQVKTYKDEYTADMVRIISGTMTADGIQNCHIALFMVDNHGDPGDNFLENGKGRVLYDSDGLAEKQTEF